MEENRLPELLLIDAYSQIFRVFYAVRGLTDAAGEPVNAIYGFTKLLLKLHREYPGPHGALLFDCGKVQFRLDLAPDYKANRPPMPEDLRRQIPLIREMAALFGWPVLEHAGYEADDLIGGFAGQYPECRVRILTSDKDLAQLVSPRVTLLVPGRDKAGLEERGPAEVREKFGVPPELIVDYLALLGDASDNIPGVPGIGAKGAAELLNTCGPAAGWLTDHTAVEQTKFGKKLADHYGVLERNRKLVALRTELPAELATPEPPARREPQWEEIRRICETHGFKSLLKEFPETAGKPAASVQAPGESLFAEEDLFAPVPEPAPAKIAEPEAEYDDLFAFADKYYRR